MSEAARVVLSSAPDRATAWRIAFAPDAIPETYLDWIAASVRPAPGG